MFRSMNFVVRSTSSGVVDLPQHPEIMTIVIVIHRAVENGPDLA